MDKNKAIITLSVALAASTYYNLHMTLAFKRLSNLTMYYATKLDDNGIVMDEFDHIAINEI